MVSLLSHGALKLRSDTFATEYVRYWLCRHESVYRASFPKTDCIYDSNEDIKRVAGKCFSELPVT
jgi:hypothetical protein